MGPGTLCVWYQRDNGNEDNSMVTDILAAHWRNVLFHQSSDHGTLVGGEAPVLVSQGTIMPEPSKGRAAMNAESEEGCMDLTLLPGDAITPGRIPDHRAQKPLSWLLAYDYYAATAFHWESSRRPKNGRVVYAAPWGSGLCRAPSRFRGSSNATLRPAVAAFSGVRKVIGSSHPSLVFGATRTPLSIIASQGQRPSALSVSDE